MAVVLEPSTGDAFRKIAKRLLGAGLAAGVGALVLFLGEAARWWRCLLPAALQGCPTPLSSLLWWWCAAPTSQAPLLLGAARPPTRTPAAELHARPRPRLHP